VPTITPTPATVWAHCRSARCPGYQQEELQGERVETAFTFGENGGDGIFVSFVEKSVVEFRADDSVLACPGCGESREISGEPRPQYMPLSGHDPMGLLSSSFDPTVRNTESDAKVAELEAKLNRLLAEKGE
jgi:hypothetical protein